MTRTGRLRIAPTNKMDRPFVHINVAATADGKIDTFERRGAAHFFATR